MRVEKIKLKNKNAQLQISFGWLFAIIVGIFILSLAIYAVVKFIGIGEQSTGAQSAAELDVLINPLETGFESGKVTFIEIPVETRLKNYCRDFEFFGEQSFEVSQKSFRSFKEINVNPESQNKYIFSNKETQGKTFYLFSKPFKMPFKVADMIYLISENEKYCFIDAPEDVFKELKGLSHPRIFLESSDNFESCLEKGTKVCFDSGGSFISGCDIKVNTLDNSIEKNSSKVYYAEDRASMYAGIFSTPEIYECQIKRLMRRLEILSMIYNEKAIALSGKGCFVKANPFSLASSADSLENSEDLMRVKNLAGFLDKDNKLSQCELW